MINEHDLKDWDYINVKTVTENPDGSANCDIEMGPIAMKHLLSYAFINCLRDAFAEGRIVSTIQTKET